ncbi:protein BRAWNIN-like [Trichosurus vulpecula]|uniref:protein BRAWNIN-like n=1 Tax=Trichosurus vulpecula TaxID=9337 RepID=UPI00186AED71|nr:protein BRAWNIN-like [Trichosurus vulpecula]
MSMVIFESQPPKLNLPKGMSWSLYLKMVAASTGAMLAGAEVVHRYYQPDLTTPEVSPKCDELKRELLGLKSGEEQDQISQQQ